MSTYLLLRSNKQSGPYSLEEIIHLGLKPYDLVWVEGRSAAWRYPSEINELKPYAPLVEEQPYDRFYKRSSDQKTGPETVKESKTTDPQNETEPENREPEKSNAVKQDKPVFISMPRKKKTAISITGQKQKGSTATETTTKRSEDKEAARNTGTGETNQVRENSYRPETERAEPVLETKYEQSLEEIKDLYKQTLLERKNRYSRKNRFKKAGKLALYIGYVAALGFLIVMTVSRKPSSPPALYSNQEQNKQTTDKETVLPVAVTDLRSAEISQEVTATDPNQSLHTGLPVKTEKQAGQDARNSSLSGRDNTMSDEAVKEETALHAEEGNGERNKVNRDQTADTKNISLSELVSVSANDYRKVAFGGIKDLQLTVANDSKYMLDLVTVELTYLKPSELPLKSEIIEFRSVAPNGTMTIKIPDTNRGIDVTYKIKEVVSGQLKAEVVRNR